ncbi:MAG TPA: NADH-quinone oxidoreductase subunit J [Thermodesulfobacteriaceae bacterium]|nr:NADH-quinone oxidoreductase subunit J [Thermodesulfobacteriaceae bacterium]
MSFETMVVNIYVLSFGILLIQVITGGLIAVLSKSLVHCFIGLVIALIGVAGIYYYLGSPLVAAMQIMIYIGAVCVAIAFGLSLTRKAGEEGLKSPGPRAAIPPTVTLVMLLATLKGLSDRGWINVPHKINEAPVGHMLLREYLLPFEVISILLTIAVIGAVSVALIRGRT